MNDSIEESARKRKELRNQYDKFIAEQNSEIKKEIENRGITKLVHFTHPDNIENIERYGLLPRRELGKHSYRFNDRHRWDRMPGVCLSITECNDYLLRSYILGKKIPDPPKFIFIKPDIILHEPCVFFDTNAARSKFKNESYLHLRSSSAFKSMFAKKVFKYEDDRYPTERTAMTADNITTDIQAEIIVAKVPPEYFIEII